MANDGSEQTAGTTAAAEAGMAQETAAVTRVSLWGGGEEYEVIEWLTHPPPPSFVIAYSKQPKSRFLLILPF